MSEWFSTNKLPQNKVEEFDKIAKNEHRSRTKHLIWVILDYLKRNKKAS